VIAAQVWSSAIEELFTLGFDAVTLRATWILTRFVLRAARQRKLLHCETAIRFRTSNESLLQKYSSA